MASSHLGSIERAPAIAAACLLALATAGCALPRAQASYGEVRSAGEDGDIRLVRAEEAGIVPFGPPNDRFPPGLDSSGWFDADRLGPGDRVQMYVYESGTPAVFQAQNGNLGEAVVDENGALYVPYAGAVRVGGMTLPQARQAVARSLRTVVREPQVDLRLAEIKSRLVSVQGNAAKPGTYPIERGRLRLVELLGETAPELEMPEMVNVTVRREGQAATVRLSEVMRNPALDIDLRPGDVIILDQLDENITVLGAVGVQGRVPITQRDFSVLDALAASRGLNDDAADPRAVFLIRPQADGSAPVVYQFEMQRPEVVALASRFPVMDNDAVLISNASYTQLRKVLQAFSMSLSPVRAAVQIAPPL
jgi:polysaccharide export outer membrane protein